MNITTIELNLRRYPVVLKDERTGDVFQDVIILEKATLTAAGLVGEGSRELIFRHFNRRGFRVLEIGKAEKKTMRADLAAFWRDAAPAE